MKNKKTRSFGRSPEAPSLRMTVWKFGLIAASLAIFALSHTASASWISDWVEDWGSDKTSFTDFEGEFAPPDPDNYPDKLTKSTNLRDYILQITNFVLSFLGLAAVIAVIYGGILYVTSGGGDEQTGKGKKTVQYAIVGLVVVLISYALVNTVIEGAGTGQEPGAGTSGGEIIDSGGVTAMGSVNVASEINDIEEAVIEAYVAFNEKSDSVEQTISYLEGKISDTETDYAENTSTYRGILNEVKNTVEKIAKNTGELSETTELANEIIQEIDQALMAQARNNIDFAKVMQADILLAAAGSCNYGDSYRNALCKISGKVEDLQDALETDFITKRDEFSEKLSELGANYSGLDVEEGFDEIVTEMENLEIDTENDTVREIAATLIDLSKAVEKITTVQAVITASVTKGNAPLTVAFDSFKSTDPTGTTITDNKITWDFGDKTATASSSQISHTYQETGSYIVTLTIESSTPGQVAAGLARVKITVEPPRSTIILEGTTDGTTTTITNSSGWKVTLSEAKSGLKFDASGSEGSDGDNIKTFTWNFGDGSEPIMETTGKQTYKYGEIGQYFFELQVEDNLGNKDRKVLKIDVGSPAARIRVTPESGDLETSFTFDAGNSRTDEGQIVGFDWTVKDKGGATVITNTEEKFSHKFTAPGTYTVDLEVSDSTGKTDTASEAVTVSSREPVAIIDYSIREPYDPAIVELSAKRSYDEDPGDILTYAWDITSDSTVDNDVAFIEGSVNSIDPVVEFSSKGTKTVKLTVKDSFGEEKSTTKTIEIRSILDVNLTIGSADENSEKLAYQLGTDGTAEVDFYPKSETAKAFEIQFGDGQKDFVENPVSGGKISHVYTKADSYRVKLIAFDSQNNTNSIEKKVAIGSGSALAMMTIKKDDKEISADETEAYSTSILEFDASQSIGGDGKSSGLSYMWKFLTDPTCVAITIGSGAEIVREKTVRRTFQDKGCYLAQLFVGDGASTDESWIFQVEVISSPPSFDTISVDVESEDLVTPVKVKLTAVGAKDADGRIVQYKWWYFPMDFPTEQQGTQLSTGESATLTINTHDNFDTDRDGKVAYGFGLEIKDNDGEIFSKNSVDHGLQTLKVTNGANQAPEVTLSADHTSVYVNEYVTFTAEAKDKEGSIKKYEWDLDGNGVFDEGDNTSMLRYQYATPDSDGISVSVKVMDEAGAYTQSNIITLYIDAKTEQPKAEFSITGQTYESAEDETLVSLDASDSTFDQNVGKKKAFFDCDSTKDKDMDGTKDNDEDVLADEGLKGACTYKDFGTKKITFNLEDAAENIAKDVAGVYLETPPEPEPPVAAFTFTLNGAKVSFQSNSTADGASDLTLTKWIWDFDTATDSNGDGTPGNDPDETNNENPTYDYSPETGDFEVKLTVYDSKGQTDSVERKVTIPEEGETPGPEAAFTYKIDADNDKKVLFDSVNSVSYAAGNLQYIWDFDTSRDSSGNGKVDDDKDSNVANPEKTYSDYGTFRVKFTVKDANGAEDAVTQSITLKKSADIPSPEADFSYSLDEIDGKKVYFNVADSFSYDAGALGYFWDFNTSEDTNKNGKSDDDKESPENTTGDIHTFTFKNYGQYSVKLTVEDSGKRTGTVEKSVYLPEPEKPEVPDVAFTYEQVTDTRKVNFTGKGISHVPSNSTVKFVWDFDASADSDGNGKASDDKDANTETVSNYEFPDFGNYSVKLTVEDSEGNKNSVTRTVSVAEPQETPKPEAAFTYSITDERTATLNANDSKGYAGNGDLTFEWDFDANTDTDKDGKKDNDYKTTNDPKIVNEYDKSGTYSVKLKVTDKKGQTSEMTRQVTIPKEDDPSPLTAAFNYEIDPGNALKVKFDTSTTVNDDAMAVFLWDTDTATDSDGNGKNNDDENAEKPDATYIYKQAGTYQVKLTVKNGNGQTDSVTRTVTVEGEKEPDAPEAAFLATVNDLKVTFTNTTVIDPDIDPDTMSYVWDFNTAKDTSGNGKTSDDTDSKETSPVYTYSSYGTYEVKLTAKDGLGRTSEITQNISLKSPEKAAPPTAAFTYTVSGTTVTFVNNSTADTSKGAVLESYEWDFDRNTDKNGDGKPSNDIDSDKKDPVAEYTSTGSYSVGLKVKDNFGNSGEISRTITIPQGEKPDAPSAAFTYTISESDEARKTVIFDGTNSAVDPDWSTRAQIESFAWDFDTASDSNGNGKKDDDYSYGNPASYTFQSYKTYTVKLRVTDTEGVSGEIERTVTLIEPETPPVIAKLQSNPAPTVSDGIIHLKADDTGTAYVAWDYSASEGDITEYILDKNIYYDSDGNGKKDDDANLTKTSGDWKKVDYSADWGKIATRLTVKNAKGEKDSVDISIVFDAPEETAPPQAAFTYSLASDSSFTAYFSTETSQAEAGIQEYVWDFNTAEDFDGDGVRNNDREAVGGGTTADPVTKTYGTYGTYTVLLKVIDKKGVEDSVSRQVVIPKPEEAQAPQAAFTFEKVSSDATGLTWQLNAENSTADPSLSIEKYIWDLDLSKDTNGNGTLNDDGDKEGKVIEKKFDTYKTYQVQLTVKDTKGKTDAISRSVTIEEPVETLDVRVSTNPAASYSDGKVHLSGTSGTVDFDFSGSTGNIRKFWLDKNIYYDTNGNGVKNDDQDLTAETKGKWSGVSFTKDWGKIVSKITVEDSKGKTDYVQVEIVFDESPAAANAGAVVSNFALVSVLAAIALFAILGTMLYLPRAEKAVFIKRPLKK